jgi:signal peptidase II
MLVSSPPVSLLNNTILVRYTENPGAMLSLGSKIPSEVRFMPFVIIVGLMPTLTLLYAVKTYSLNSMQLIGLSLIPSGGIGNYLDRIFNNGAAVDFMNIGIGPIRTGIFNVADVFIIAGTSIFILSSFRGQTKAITS